MPVGQRGPNAHVERAHITVVTVDAPAPPHPAGAARTKVGHAVFAHYHCPRGGRRLIPFLVVHPGEAENSSKGLAVVQSPGQNTPRWMDGAHVWRSVLNFYMFKK